MASVMPIVVSARRDGPSALPGVLQLQHGRLGSGGNEQPRADHEVILFDNAGVGASGGETPHTVVEMTHHCVAFCRALGLKAIHVVGFSLGGMIAQQLALDHPHLVRRLILLGTGPRGGEGMTFTELSPEEQADPVAFLLGAFFSPSEASQAAGSEYMKRLESRKKDRDLPVSRDSAVAQLAAIREWGTIPPTGRYATLKNITHPTLIVHGNKDRLKMDCRVVVRIGL